MADRTQQPPWPCALCRKRIFGAHWRVYAAGGLGCDLVCPRCSLLRVRREGELWSWTGNERPIELSAREIHQLIALGAQYEFTIEQLRDIAETVGIHARQAAINREVRRARAHEWKRPCPA